MVYHLHVQADKVTTQKSLGQNNQLYVVDQTDNVIQLTRNDDVGNVWRVRTAKKK